MAKHNDISKTDPTEIEALIKRLKQSNLAPRDWSSDYCASCSRWPRFSNPRTLRSDGSSHRSSSLARTSALPQAVRLRTKPLIRLLVRINSRAPTQAPEPPDHYHQSRSRNVRAMGEWQPLPIRARRSRFAGIRTSRLMSKPKRSSLQSCLSSYSWLIRA